jgi:hypothetical protein
MPRRRRNEPDQNSLGFDPEEILRHLLSADDLLAQLPSPEHLSRIMREADREAETQAAPPNEAELSTMQRIAESAIESLTAQPSGLDTAEFDELFRLIDSDAVGLNALDEDDAHLPEPDPSLTAADAATWMQQQVTGGTLYQEDAVWHIRRHFGRRFTYTNANGNLAIAREVLREFMARTRATVVWERGDRCWRWRRADDPSHSRIAD